MWRVRVIEDRSLYLRNSRAAITPPAMAPYAVRLMPFSMAVSHFSATLSSLVVMVLVAGS